ncbi:MAG TPA: peptidoglycan-binding domain-containing protein [Trebonia sp.]|nr:peptidoglycan-binding domain-containing protein [Trebonia sp.]
MSTQQPPDLVSGTELAPATELAPTPRPPAARRGRPAAIVVTGVALAAAAGFAARGLWPGGTHLAVTSAVPVGTAVMVRTDLSARQQVAGTLGYAGFFTVASETDSGLLTWLPAPGDVVRRGHPLFAVDGQPATLLYGAIPAWRTFAPGMSPGADIGQLQRNLAALGFAPGPADGQFGWSTEAAVERWQQARGMTVTGTIPLGEVAFLPGPLRVTTVVPPLGATVTAGTNVLSGTSLTPAVRVWLGVGGPAVRRGDQVLVTLPDGTTTVKGTVRSVGRVATAPGDAGTGSGSSGTGTTGGSSGGSSDGGSGSADVIPVTISIASAIPGGLDQAPVQVSITDQHADGVLAVPVTALLAAPDGGYEVQVAGAAPRGRLIPVTTGLFDDASGLVAITGPGLAAGLSVTVAQG